MPALEPRVLIDALGRRLDYLRLSVTARCNFRCSYCLPAGCAQAEDGGPLSLDEIDRLVGAFSSLGFWKVRLTGGEPTLRGDIVEMVGRIARTPGIRRVGMTTNGYRLASIARELSQAGLRSLNVSVDSLDAGRFAELTGRPLLGPVLRGVDEAIAAGIPQVKVNVVLLAGTSRAEIDRFIGWTRASPITVRFIELMEATGDAAFFARNHVAVAHVERLLATDGWGRLPRLDGQGPAIEFAREGYAGRVGIIGPSRSEACARCNRLRVSSAGELRLCLFDRRAIPLRHLLREDTPASALRNALRAAVRDKPAAFPDAPVRASLSLIGG